MSFFHEFQINYSMCEPLGLITVSILGLILLHVFRKYSLGMALHCLMTEAFRAAILLWGDAQAFDSIYALILLSRRFKSGELGGHKTFSQKYGMFFLSHFWVFLAVWGGATSCWYTILASGSKLEVIHSRACSLN